MAMRNDERQKKLSAGRDFFESQRTQLVLKNFSALLRKHAGTVSFFEAIRSSDVQKDKPVIVFKVIDDGRMVGKCPNCNLFALEFFKRDGKFFLKCESCGVTCAADDFELRYEVGKCPKCDLFALEFLKKRNGKFALRCLLCGFLSMDDLREILGYMPDENEQLMQ